MLVRTLTLLLICAAFVGCSDNTVTSASDEVAYSQTDLRFGTGAEAVNGSTITVNYTLWLFDRTKTDQKGLQVETSLGGSPFVFVLGRGAVIKGWDQGVPGMKVGGIRKLVVPSSLAYGGVRSRDIPPYTPLVFEIELLDVQ